MSEDLDKDKLIGDLFSKYRQKMYKQALSMVKNPADAEDAVQNAFVHISGHLEEISQKSDKDIEGYLIKTVKNVCFDYIRSENRMQISDIDELEISIGRSVEDEVISKHTIGEIKETLNELSERDRDILYLCLFKDQAPNDIARMLKISKRNISMYITRARKRLIKELRKRGITNDL